MDSTQKKIIVMKSGEQVPVSSVDGVVIHVMVPGDPVRNVFDVNMDDKAFAVVRKQAMTNKIRAAILRDRKTPEI